MNEAEFDQEFSVEEMMNLYGVYSLEDLDRIEQWNGIYNDKQYTITFMGKFVWIHNCYSSNSKGIGYKRLPQT